MAFAIAPRPGHGVGQVGEGARALDNFKGSGKSFTVQERDKNMNTQRDKDIQTAIEAFHHDVEDFADGAAHGRKHLIQHLRTLAASIPEKYIQAYTLSLADLLEEMSK